MINPYEPGTLGYDMFESNRPTPDNPIVIPTNLPDWIGAMGVMFGLFGAVLALVDHDFDMLPLRALEWAASGVAVVLAVYGVISGPRLLFNAVVWVMRKSVIAKAAIWGGLIGAVAGIALGIAMNDELLIGTERLGSFGAVIGLVVGIMLWFKRRVVGKARA